MTFQEFVDKYQKVPVEEYKNNVFEKIPAPLVSCRVSTYQHAPYIRECLDGILMQKTNFPFEIVIGEDESSDGTREICIEYANKYPDKIRLFLHKRENNILIDGRPSAKFQGTYTKYKLRGKYQTLCEGDDYWTDPFKLQKQVDFLETHEDHVLVATGYNVADSSTKEILRVVTGSIKINCDFGFAILRGGELCTASLLHKNMLITRDKKLLDTSLKVPGDYVTVLDLALNGKLAVLSDITCTYRTNNEQSAMGKLRAISLDRLIVYYENIEKMLITYNEVTEFIYAKVINEKISKFYLNILVNRRADLNVFQAFNYIKHQRLKFVYSDMIKAILVVFNFHLFFLTRK